MRVDYQKNASIASTWATEGKRNRGRPRETQRRTVQGKRQMMGIATWNEAVAVVRDRADWRRLANGPILPD